MPAWEKKPRPGGSVVVVALACFPGSWVDCGITVLWFTPLLLAAKRGFYRTCEKSNV